MDQEWKDFRISKLGRHWNVAQIIEIWDSLFNISYIDFRKSLRAISHKSLSQQFSNIQFSFTKYHLQFKTSTSGFVFPIDEDDWICDGFVESFLDSYQLGCRIYAWERSVYWVNSFYTEPKGCSSCSYILAAPFDDKEVMRHGEATRLFNKNEHRRKVIPKTLSIHNKNMSSLSLYGQEPTKEKMLQWYQWQKESEKVLPVSYEGFRKSYEEQLDLYDRLKLK
jgi:hypothetical protein